MKRFVLWAAMVAAVATPAVCRAHFLFIRIGPHAEAGRHVEVFFSEQAKAGDPRFIDKVAHTQLWLQTEPGKFSELPVAKATDRLRGYLPVHESLSVIGQCEYGVLKREKSFLLRYYPKAISGKPSELTALTARREIPLEIMAVVEGDAIRMTVLREGKPLPGALLTTVDKDLVNEEVTADAQGYATWKPKTPGQYAIYTKHVTPQSGTKNGQAYDEIREFATLAFSWPLDTPKPDTEAVAMFEKALATRAMWNNFPGFKAAVAGSVDGRAFTGKVAIDGEGDVKLELDDEVANDWVSDQLQSLVTHRLVSSNKRSPPMLSFADDETNHPLGRLLMFHGGRFASSYRVRGDELTAVNRQMGETNMSITVLKTDRSAEGKVLSRAFVVQYWNAKTGALEKIESFQNDWQRVGLFDLPAAIVQTFSSDAGLQVRRMDLSGLELGK